jgi:hypothetical protein
LTSSDGTVDFEQTLKSDIGVSICMSFSILDQHSAIAWDFDNTLVDHAKSEAIHKYIRRHPEKRHVIVTFRSFGWQHEIWEILAKYLDAPPREAFDGLINIDDGRFYPAEPTAGPHVDHARLHDALRTINDRVFITDVASYIEWKGGVCREHGLTVLVDDMREHVIAGCERHGICYINPDDL